MESVSHTFNTQLNIYLINKLINNNLYSSNNLCNTKSDHKGAGDADNATAVLT